MEKPAGNTKGMKGRCGVNMTGEMGHSSSVIA